MSPPHSIESRLQLGLGLSLALLIAGAWWLGHEALHHTAEAYVLSRLQHDAEALLGALELGPDDGVHLGRRRITPVYDQPYSGHYFVMVIDGSKTLSSRSLWDRSLTVRPLTPGASTHWRETGPLGQDLLVWSGGFRRDGRAITLLVAEDLAPLRAPLQSFERLFALMAVAGLVAMLLLQRLVLRRAFARLEPVYRDIDALESGGTAALTESVPTEILPLVRKINGLLSAYSKRLERSRNAAGNLAHALKAPLSLMMRQLETNERAPDPGTRALLAEQVERVRGLLERELKRTRLAGGGGTGGHFEPDAELSVLKRLLERMYPDKALELECRIGIEGVLPADREDMLELIGTLLDNACKWARRRVLCALEPTTDGVRFSVDDDGPGCSQSELEAIAARGVRLDEAIHGHGLGLSIAREIVDLYQGRLTLGHSNSLGGFRAEVSLPIKVPPAVPA